MKQIHQKLLKKVEQLFEDGHSSYFENSSVQLIDILHMQDSLRRENLITNELQFDVENIKDKLQSVRVGQKISFCYIYLKKIMGEDQEIMTQKALESPYEQPSSLQYELSVSKFDVISYLVSVIVEISQLSQSQQYTQDVFKQLFFDIVNIYLTSYKYFIKANLLEYTPKSEQRYRRGEELIKKVELIVGSQEILALKKQIYDFRFISLFHFSIGNAKKLLILQIFKNFIDFYFSNYERLVQLYTFEYHSKYMFLDYFYENYCDSDHFMDLNQRITDLETLYPNHFYLLDMKWKLYIKYLKKQKVTQQQWQIIKSSVQKELLWETAFYQLIYYDQRRIITIFKELAYLKQSESFEIQEFCNSWKQTVIQQIIKDDLEKNQQLLIQLLILILENDKLKNLEQENYCEMLRSITKFIFFQKTNSQYERKSLQIILKSYQILDNIYLKSLFDIIKLAQHIFYKWSPQGFIDDQELTVTLLELCSHNYDELRLINLVILGLIIKGYFEKLSNDSIPIGRLYSLFQRYSKLLITSKNKSQVLIDQIRLMIRTCLCCYSIREAAIQSPRDMQSSDFIYFHSPLLDLRTTVYDSVEQVIQFPKEYFVKIDPLSDFLKQLVELIRVVQVQNQDELYDIVICVLKLINVHLKAASSGKEDCSQINIAFNPIQQVAYKLTVQFMLKPETNSKQISNIMSALLRIVNDNENFQEFKLTFQNSKPYYNWKFLEIFISVIFECSMVYDLKRQYLNELASILNHNKTTSLMFSPILDKFILLLATEEDIETQKRMVSIINNISKAKFTVGQFNQLLRLCLANSQKSLIFSNLIPEQEQYLKPLQEQINQQHSISIFDKSQFPLKYNFRVVTKSVLEILEFMTKQIKKNKEKRKCFLVFKDVNSKVSISTKLDVQKGFTIFFELKYFKPLEERNTIFDKISCIDLLTDNNFNEFATIYFNDENSKDISGIKILIQPYQLKVIYFQLSKQKSSEMAKIKIQTQKFIIQNPSKEPKLFSYRITYNFREQFQCYINQQKCESEKERIKINIDQFTKVDLGHSVQTEQSLSLILTTQAFELQETSFKGNLYQFQIFNKVVQQITNEQWAIQLQMRSQDFSIQYNTSFAELQGQEFTFEQYSEKEGQKIKQLEHTQKQVSQINKTQLLSIFQSQKAPVFLMLILEEIINLTNSAELTDIEDIIQRLLLLLLNDVIQLDPLLLDQFFDNLQFFISILEGILQKYKITHLLLIFQDLLKQLSCKSVKYLDIFIDKIMLKFSLYENQNKKNEWQKMFFLVVLGTYHPNLQSLISAMQTHQGSTLLQSTYFFQFFGNLLLHSYNAHIDSQFRLQSTNEQLLNTDALFQIYLKQIQCINSLFKFQKFTSDYLRLLKDYFMVVFKKCPKIVNYFGKYSSQVLILNQSKDYLYLSQFLKTIWNYQNFDCDQFWNALSILFYLEKKHQMGNSSQQNQKLTQFLFQKSELVKQLSYNTNQIEIILEDLTSQKLQFVFIDLLAELFHQKKDEATNVKVLSLIYWQNLDNKKLLEMQKHSKIEYLLDTLTCLEHNTDFDDLIQKMFLNRLIDDYLTNEPIHISRLYKLLSSSPKIFYQIFSKIIERVSDQKNKNIILHVNLIHLFKIMEQECFGEKYDEVLISQYVQSISKCLDYLHMRNFFAFAEEYTNQDLEVKLIGNPNFLPYGGLFRLFTSMIITAKARRHEDFVIQIAIKLLDIYYECLKSHPDDSFVNQVYAHFQCRRDQSGVAFPIMVEIFEHDFQINSEYLSNQKSQLTQLIKKSKCITDPFIENLRKSKQILYSRFKNQSKLIKTYTENFCCQTFSYRRSKCFQDSSNIQSLTTNFTESANIQMNFDQRDEQQQISKKESNYINFYLYHNINQQGKFSKIRQILEDSLKVDFKPYQLQFSYYHTNSLDFENRIIFSESENQKQGDFEVKIQGNIVLQNKNQQIQLQSNNSTISVLRSNDYSILIRQAEMQCIKEYCIALKNKQFFSTFLKECKSKDIFYCINPVEDFRSIIQQKWIEGKLSNYQYIFLLNHYGGRNLLDENNYYIFPWIQQDFNQEYLCCNRNLQSSYYKQRNPIIYLYFSNSKQIKNFLQIGLNKSPNLVDFLNEIQKFGEAIPEIYSSVHFFRNFKFPLWVPTQTCEEFIYIMRQSLEQLNVQQQLPHWIDIIFGIYSNPQASKKKESTICHYHEITQEDKSQVIQEFGQQPKQIFTSFHPHKQLLFSLYQNQQKLTIDVKNLLLDFEEKIISIYHQPFCYLFVITENGIAHVLETEQRLLHHLIERQVLKQVQKKNLQVISKLHQNLVTYIDFDNQQLPDNQESQSHFMEYEAQSLFLKPSMFTIIAGYKNEFQVFQGAQMKLVQVCHTNETVTCIKFCHYRQTLIVGQYDSQLGLWKVKKSGEVLDPYCMITSHKAPIVAIDFCASKILSIDSINEAHVHYYDGQLATVIQLDTVGRITYCQISYTMNLYIFLDSFNQMMAYTVYGEKYIEPIEYLQQITTLLPITKFSSQFFFTTKGDLYFDDFFNIKLQQSGKTLDSIQQERVYNYNFRNLKSLKQGNLLPQIENSGICASAITQMGNRELCFLFFGCEDGKLWCCYKEDAILAFITKQFERSGLV